MGQKSNFTSETLDHDCFYMNFRLAGQATIYCYLNGPGPAPRPSNVFNQMSLLHIPARQNHLILNKDAGSDLTEDMTMLVRVVPMGLNPAITVSSSAMLSVFTLRMKAAWPLT